MDSAEKHTAEKHTAEKHTAEKQKILMKGCDNEGYDNEGFLYINNRHHSQKKEDDSITFKKGMIRDSDGQMVCLGEIVPICASRLDEDFATYMMDIKYWMPILRGVKIRVYWHAASNEFNISSAGKIYPNESTLFISKEKINEQINFALLDKTMCYYAIIEREAQIIHLTHIVKNSSDVEMITLDHIRAVDTDRAFTTHIIRNPCETDEEIVKVLTKEKNREAYGIIFIKTNGVMIEFTNKEYDKIRMLEKPDYIDYAEYYVHALNSYPDESETNFDTYFEKELHYDIINEMFIYFPEYIPYFDKFKQNLKDYIERNSIDIKDTESEEESQLDVDAGARDDAYFLLENAKDIKDVEEYIEIYYEITKSSINPIFKYKDTDEENSIDMKKIKFTRKLLDTLPIDDIIRIIK